MLRLLQLLLDPLIALLHPLWSLPLAFTGYLYPSVLVTVNRRAYKLDKQLGEGGYAYVYLAQEVPCNAHSVVDGGARYALKKVLASTPERLEAAQREATIQQQASHPCLLPLLDWAVVPPPADKPDASHTIYLLSPAYTDGTLADELARLGAARTKALTSPGQPPLSMQQQQQLSSGCVLSTRQVLSVFQQLCLALDALHKAGYAHRDVKTHNILIKRPQSANGGLNSVSSHSDSVAAPSTPPRRPAPSLAHAYGGMRSSSANTRDVRAEHASITVNGFSPRSSDGGATTFKLPTRSSASGAGAVPIDAKDVLAARLAKRASIDPEAGLPLGTGGSGLYGAVLMDFGSAGPRYLTVSSRKEALLLQEDAEANCTATFRAPELWDTPSPCTLDQGAADVWAAGCTLYAAMYGQSPFQISLDQGGSLALAVLNNRIPWPKDPLACYPPQLHDLVLRCLAADPSQRPSAAALAAAAGELLLAQPRLPDPPLYTAHPPTN